jgi:DNA mismatch repair protein MutS
VNGKELIVNTNDVKTITEIELQNGIHCQNRIVHLFYNKMVPKYSNIVYCNNFLGKIYETGSFLTPIEYLNLEKYQETVISFVILLHFCYEHNERIINKIKIPVEYEYNNHLIMYNNAIYQLDVIEYNKYKDSEYKSLFHILNQCSTYLGKRLLYYRILNPITDKKELTRRYDQIQYILDGKLVTDLKMILKNICDIERFHRRMSLKMLHPHEYHTSSGNY